jgi:predicted AlkP superfamily pyrophosphatase or phosphodiesterase
MERARRALTGTGRSGAVALLLAAALLTAGTARGDSPPARHVALLSIDGLSPTDLVPGGPCGAAPARLRALMASGAWAKGVAGVLPTVTYPAHATLVTGVPPTVHGVVANQRADGADWHLDRSDIQVPTLWDAAREAGLPVAIVTWPSSYGADVEYLIPENLAYSGSGDARELLKGGSTPGLFEALERVAGPATLLPFEHPDAGIPLDRMTGAFAAEIVRRHRPRLLLAHFLDLDHRQHAHGPGSPEACAALERIDALVGEIHDAYREAGLAGSIAFVVVSDHGFVPVHTVINLAVVLAGEGGAAPAADDGWTRIVNNGGSAAVYAAGAAAPTRAARVRALVESRLQGIVRWMGPAEAAGAGGFPGSAFVLCASPGYLLLPVAGRAELALPSGQTRGGHGFCPEEPGMDATFLASGAGVRPLGALPRIRMIDIAPTVAALLGVELPAARGVPVAGVVDGAPGG